MPAHMVRTRPIVTFQACSTAKHDAVAGCVMTMCPCVLPADQQLLVSDNVRCPAQGWAKTAKTANSGMSAAGKTGGYVMYAPFLQSLYDSLLQPRPLSALSQAYSSQPAAREPSAPRYGSLQARPATGAAQPSAAGPEVYQATAANMHGGAALATHPLTPWSDKYAAGRLPMAEKEPYPYFFQQAHWPHNRRECDTFNKFHFDRLKACREARGVTPKVNEEPLTAYEVEYAQQVHRARSQSPLVRPRCYCRSCTTCLLIGNPASSTVAFEMQDRAMRL